MCNRQFNFSLTVGVAIAAIGAIIISKAPVGLSLIVLGVTIAGLALFTRFAGRATGATIRSRQARDNAPGYRTLPE